MTDQQKQALQAVIDLNELIYVETGDQGLIWLEFFTNGTCEIIQIGGITLWSSEDDERKWIDANNDYEYMLHFLIRKLTQIKLQFNSFKFLPNGTTESISNSGEDVRP